MFSVRGLTAFNITSAMLYVLLAIADAQAHWNMEPRFWPDDSNEMFFFRIHNGAHANRNPAKKELNVCFWIEEVRGAENRAVSGKKCNAVVMKPDEWMTFEFSIKDVTINEAAASKGKLKAGKYRAVAQAREQRGWFMKLILGAAMERVYNYFEVK
jgi:hypothetical protein